jgi:hypothetical protein
VEVWDKNSFPFDDKLVCRCEIPLKPAGGKLDKEVELISKMQTAKGEDRGTVNVLVQLSEAAVLSVPALDLPQGFEVGVIKISKIQALGLQNKEWTGKQVSKKAAMSFCVV